jgi:NmrA-like family
LLLLLFLPNKSIIKIMVSPLELKMALNKEIASQGHSDAALTRAVPVEPTAKARTYNTNSSNTEWGSRGVFKEQWPEHLPRPPSMRRLKDGEDDANDAKTKAKKNAMPKVIVFNANTQEGSSMVRVLSEKGLTVVAVVRVFTSRNTKRLMKLKNVEVQVADLNNMEAVKQAGQGCQQAFLVTKYWEHFENWIEEGMAQVVLRASSEVGISRLVLATFEDTTALRSRGLKSQLMPTADGRIFPKFEGMDSIQEQAKQLKNISVTHMFTSYLDDAEHKKSLILIRGENGKIVVQDQVQTPSKKAKQ